jgi:(R,R)-butanediol dehydrogenase / meso-butanediol dehydrogenase / diacetyl reductase
MKASYYHGKKTLKLGESIPRKPGPDEVRIRVAFCGICGTDLHIYKGGMDKRVSIPQVIGHEMSGEIAEVGSQVKGWSAGDRVVVRPLQPCGTCPACKAGHSHVCYNLKFLGIDTPGAFQSSWTVPAHTLHRIPSNLSFDQAALIEPVAVACHDIRRGELKGGEESVVIGGGPIGLLIALVAVQAGARVLISEVNPFRLHLARDLGLEAVNPKETDLNDFISKRTGGTGADVVFEVTGTPAGAAVMTQLVRVRGRIVVVGVFGDPSKVDLFRFFWRELDLYGARVYEPQDFDKAIALAASGVLPLERLISARWPVTELQKAFEQIEAGTDLMKVLINTQGE